MNEGPISKEEFEALSEFRFQIRRFERFSEDIVQAQGKRPARGGRAFAGEGERLLELLAGLHRAELRSLGGTFLVPQINL